MGKPKIRFEGYEEDWEQRKLGEVAKKTYGGGTPKTSEQKFWNGRIPWIQSADLIEHEVQSVMPKKGITEVGVQKSSAQLIPGNSIAIVTRVGVGKLALIPFPYATSQDFLSLSELNIDEKFGCYVIYTLLQKEKHLTQGTSIKGITKEELLNKKILLPIQEEQQKIGEYLSDLDHLITLHHRKSKIFEKMMTYVWEQRKLGEMIDVWSGRDYKHLEAGDIPVYGTGGYMLSVSEALSDNKDAIGIGRKGTIDRPFVLKAPFWTVDTLFYCIPKRNYDLSFVFDIFQNVNWKAMDESTGVPSLSKAVINKIETLSPNYEEQKKIGTYFSDLDRLITLHHRKRKIIVKIVAYVWEQRRFGELGSVSMCKRIFKEQTSMEGEIPFYKIGTFGAIPDAFISRDLFEEYKEKFQYPTVGDMLLSASGTIGRTVEYKGEDAYFQDSNIVWFKHDERIDNSFLKCLYSIVKWSGIEGSTIKRLYNDNFMKTEFYMPSVYEQKKIGQYFSTLDSLITLHHHKLFTPPFHSKTPKEMTKCQN